MLSLPQVMRAQSTNRAALVVDVGAGTTDFCVMNGRYPTDEDQRTLPNAGDWIDRFQLVYMPLVISAYDVPSVDVLLVSGGVRTELPLESDQTAVVRRIPVQLKTASPMNAVCARYDTREIRLVLHGRGPLPKLQTTNEKVATLERYGAVRVEVLHFTPELLNRLEAAGVNAILVGEHLMAQDDLGAAVRRLLGR